MAKGTNDKIARGLRKQEYKVNELPKKQKIILIGDVHMEDVESAMINSDDWWRYLKFEVNSMGDSLTAGKIAPFGKIFQKKIPKKGSNGIIVLLNNLTTHIKQEKYFILKPNKPLSFGLELGSDDYLLRVKGLTFAPVTVKVTAYNYFPHLKY